MRELPALEAVSKQYAKKVLAVVGITPDDVSIAKATVKRAGVSFPNLIDDMAAAGRAFNVHGIPRTLIVDKQGVIRADVAGAMTESEFKEELRKAGIR